MTAGRKAIITPMTPRNPMKNLYRQYGLYPLLMLLGLGLFAYAELNGTRLLGDDKESTSSSSRGYRGGRSGFYHK
jgi:hypothetical protein